MRKQLMTSAAAAVLMAMAGANPALAANPPVGLRVYVEQWNPALVPGENLAVLENNPTAITDTMNAAWSGFRTWYLKTLPPLLARPNYLHSQFADVPSGITLYSYGGGFQQPPAMTLPAQPDLTLVPQGPNAFEANFHVPGSSISLCSTTPTPVGQEGDPCATFYVDVYLSVAVKITDTPGQLLQVTGAGVSLSQFHYNNLNPPAQVAAAIADLLHFFGGPDYQALLVKTIDSQQLDVKDSLQAPIKLVNSRLAAYEQVALNDVNQLLKPAASFDRLIHIGVWARNTSTQQTLTLLFAPPVTGVALDPAHQNGHFSGTLTFDSNVQPLPASCSDYNRSPQIDGQVQTGPRPVIGFDPFNNPIFGNAPMQSLAVAFNGGALQGRQCSYTLGGLALGLPNFVNFSDIHLLPSGMPQAHKTLDIEPARGGNPVVLGPAGTIVAVGSAAPSSGGAGGSAILASVAMRGPPPMQLRTTSGSGAGTSVLTPAAATVVQTPNGQAPQTLNLTASIGVVLSQGVGALPRQQLTQQVSPGDPALGSQLKASTPVSQSPAPAAALPKAAAATTTAPSWGQPASTGVSAGMGAITASGGATLGAQPPLGAQPALGTSIRGGQTLQQPATAPSAIHTAPGSLGSR